MDNQFLIRDLVYGVSGSGKTSWWLQLARFLWQTKGLRTRWYLGDGGGGTLKVVDAEKFLQIMPYSLWDHPFETTAKLCDGYFPADPTKPNSPLLPPGVADWGEIGLVVFEGLSVMADYLMGDRDGGLANRMAKGQVLNNDASFSFTDGQLKVGGNARTHYNLAQRRILSLVDATRALPVHVGWTAHERKVEDEYREAWIGPDVVGQMLTTKIGMSFENTIHLHTVKTKRMVQDPLTKKPVEQVIVSRRAYTRTHFDPDQLHHVKFYANTRLDPALDPGAFPEQFEPPDPIAYYTALQEAREAAARLTAETHKNSTLKL